ncbi:FMN-linked oxidoreductase [Lactarius hengduanensis]|nr:FMN-linked oxidoreductase [Lactarius hengduanensis]
MASPVPKLFQSIQVGTANLQHRVVLAPMKRARADGRNVLGELGLEYYKQRTSTPGTLVISEGTFLALHAGGAANITDTVHANGSSIYLQLWVLGRVAEGDVLRKAGGYEVVAPSAIALEGHETPRPLTVAEIKEYVQLYASAAENAVLKAGFDGVEVQVTSGYLLDQFLQPVTNTRTDEYGGSLENHLRFVLEVTDTVVKAVGANKVGLRISPYLTIQGMGVPDPIPTYTKLVTSIRDSYPDFAYLHVIKITHIVGPVTRPSTKFLRDIWGDRPYIANGGLRARYSHRGDRERRWPRRVVLEQERRLR